MENINNRVDEPSGSRCYKEGVRKKFDCYCKRFIRNAAYDVARTATRNLEREKLLPDEEMEEMISDSGFQDEGTAEAKLCQDIVLKAIAESGMGRNATIKGGVVMRSISKNARRATQDLDLDFIRYSISDDSIKRFIGKLDCLDGLKIGIAGNITELNHQDYKGKRITLTVEDTEGTMLSLKMDIGVHADLTLEQEEYAFDVGFQDDAVSLLINSRHQMITEKLKSLVRFGSRSTRYKDVFDIYYLKDEVDVDKLRGCIEKYIFADNTLRKVTSMDEVVKRVERVFTNKKYISDLEKSGKNWLGVSTDTVLKEDVDFLKSI